jgi:hypothetical protein
MLHFYHRRNNHATPKLDEKQFHQLRVATASLGLDIAIEDASICSFKQQQSL